MADLHKQKRLILGQDVGVDLPARTQAYRIALMSPSGKIHILPDILDYTGVLSHGPASNDPYVHMRALGRRDVGLHILENLILTPEELYSIWRGKPNIKQEDFTRG